MDALLQLMSCFLNAIMYMILIYYFLPETVINSV